MFAYYTRISGSGRGVLVGVDDTGYTGTDNQGLCNTTLFGIHTAAVVNLAGRQTNT